MICMLLQYLDTFAVNLLLGLEPLLLCELCQPLRIPRAALLCQKRLVPETQLLKSIFNHLNNKKWFLIYTKTMLPQLQQIWRESILVDDTRKQGTVSRVWPPNWFPFWYTSLLSEILASYSETSFIIVFAEQQNGLIESKVSYEIKQFLQVCIDESIISPPVQFCRRP